MARMRGTDYVRTFIVIAADSLSLSGRYYAVYLVGLCFLTVMVDEFHSA